MVIKGRSSFFGTIRRIMNCNERRVCSLPGFGYDFEFRYSDVNLVRSQSKRSGTVSSKHVLSPDCLANILLQLPDSNTKRIRVVGMHKLMLILYHF